MNPIIARVKNSALTFPQVHAPGLAGALVRSSPVVVASQALLQLLFIPTPPTAAPHSASVNRVNATRRSTRKTGAWMASVQLRLQLLAPAQKLERNIVDVES